MTKWTFITKHAVALGLIAAEPRITALEISKSLNITERAVRKVIADLCEAGYVGKKREGRGVVYRINPNMPLRQEIYNYISVVHLLNALDGKGQQGDEGACLLPGESLPESHRK
ncbi:MAG: winged helix-turn-helix domain-containing protein [Chloroflexota bacterium]